MTTTAIIQQVAAAMGQPEIYARIGAQANAAHDDLPRIVWVPDTRDPMPPRQNESRTQQSLAEAHTLCVVTVWGADLDSTEALFDLLVGTCINLFTNWSVDIGKGKYKGDANNAGGARGVAIVVPITFKTAVTVGDAAALVTAESADMAGKATSADGTVTNDF